MAQCIHKYNMDTILSFLYFVPDGEVINCGCISLKVFERYFAKALCENVTIASLIKNNLF